MKYNSSVGGILEGMQYYHLEERIKQIEEKVFPQIKRKKATKSQKLLLMKDLGLLELIEGLNLQQTKKALLISLLIDADADNIEKDLNQIHQKDSKLNNEPNFEFLFSLYKELDLTSLQEKAEEALYKIQNAKEISPKRK